MADTKTATKTSGKSMLMINLPEDIKNRVTQAASERSISNNRWVAELVAKEFGVALPEPGRKTTSLRAKFELENPRTDGETDEAYTARYEVYKKAAQTEAREKHAQRTKEALDLMETLRSKMNEGTLDQASIAELLANLKG